MMPRVDSISAGTTTAYETDWLTAQRLDEAGSARQTRIDVRDDGGDQRHRHHHSSRHENGVLRRLAQATFVASARLRECKQDADDGPYPCPSVHDYLPETVTDVHADVLGCAGGGCAVGTTFPQDDGDCPASPQICG